MLSRIELTRAILIAHRGPATLLYGVGARSLSFELCAASGAGSADTLAISRPNSAEAIAIAQWASRAPCEGDSKVLLICMDEMSALESEKFLNLTEGQADWFSVIFTSWHRLSSKLESRCDVFHLENFSEQTHDSLVHVKAKVLPVLKALAMKDRALMEKAAAGFDTQALEVLMMWAAEAATGRWDLFSAEESFNLDSGVARRVLIALSPDIRPKLLVKTAFEELM